MINTSKEAIVREENIAITSIQNGGDKPKSIEGTIKPHMGVSESTGMSRTGTNEGVGRENFKVRKSPDTHRLAASLSSVFSTFFLSKNEQKFKLKLSNVELKGMRKRYG